MSDLHAKVSQIRQRLHREFIEVDAEWLNECVEYFVDSEPSISISALYEKTIEQWRLSDIEDVGVGCLPDSVAQAGLVQLRGNYALQMQFVIDIAESAYDQLRKLYNQKLDQTETEAIDSKKNESKKKRSLKLELTDGKRTVVAMEYKPIACLNTKLLPGCKILLVGPLRCVDKVLLLEPANVKILGGEVSKYEIENAFENVLLRQLNRPINPNPQTEYIEQRVVEECSRNKPNIAALQEQHRLSQRERSIAVNEAADIFGDDDLLLNLVDDDFSSIPSTIQPPRRTLNTAHRPPPVEESLDGLLDDDAFDDIIESIPAAREAPQQQQIPDDIDMDYESIDHEAEEYERQCFEENMRMNRMDFESTRSHVAAPSVQSSASITPPVLPTTVSPITIADDQYPFKIRGCNLATIAQLNALSDTASKLSRTFMIKADLHNVFDRLQVKRMSWTIGVDVRDASREIMQLRFGDDVLNKLTGSSAAEVTEMRKRAKSMPQLTENITEILGKLKETLETINCFMKIQFVRDESGGVALAANGLELIDSAPVLERILSNKMREES